MTVNECQKKLFVSIKRDERFRWKGKQLLAYIASSGRAYLHLKGTMTIPSARPVDIRNCEYTEYQIQAARLLFYNLYYAVLIFVPSQ
jgi:hypothetical protein